MFELREKDIVPERSSELCTQLRQIQKYSLSKKFRLARDSNP